MVIFKSKQKKLEGDLKIKLCGKIPYPTESVKSLDVKIAINLSWQCLVNDLSIKLNRANALLYKIRKYFSLEISRSIYFAIFDFYLSYCCLVWTQNRSTIQQIVILQKRQLELLTLVQGILIPVLYSKTKKFILKFQNKFYLRNILFVRKSLNTLTLSVFRAWFIFSSDQHNYETSGSTQDNFTKRFYKTNRQGQYSITASAVES